MLIYRVAIAAVLIPLLIAIFYLDALMGPTAPILLVLLVLLAVRGAGEMTELLKTRNFDPNRWLVTVGCVFVTSASWFGRLAWSPIHIGPDDNTLAQVMLAYSLVVLLLFAHAAWRYREPGKSMETLSVELLIVSYIGVLLGIAAQLRWVAGADAGYIVIGSLVFIVKGGDVGAYTLGRLFGRAKMAPHLSPGKTWMGGLGALVGSAAGAWLWFRFTPGLVKAEWTPPVWYWTVLYGAILGVVGLIGDLCESLIKRDVGKKDSARLLPGFGGLLDLLDSVLYAGPVAYILWKAIPLATWKMPGEV